MSESPVVPARHPGIYLLPNLLTTGALFSGFYAIVAAINGQFVPAVTAVFVAGLMVGRTPEYVGKKIEADGRRVPPQLKKEFAKAGPGKAIGPFRSPKGLQLWGYCGSRKITPPMPKAQMPTRDQIKAALVNEKYDGIEAKYSAMMRKGLLIEYRDPSYAE